MGLFDSFQTSINRGASAAGRATSTMRLKAQMSDALKRRQSLAAQLGASLYEATKDTPEFRAGREALYDGIAALDAARAQCQAEIDRIEAESQAAQVAATHLTCPFCGSSVGAGDLFCAGCGKPMAEIQAALSAQQPVAAAWNGPTCPDCGSPVNVGDMFCMNCGHRFEAPAGTEPSPAAEPVVEPVAAPETEAVMEPSSFSPVEPVYDAAPAPAHAADPVAEQESAPAPAANVCPTCGTPFEPGDKFCMGCGTPL